MNISEETARQILELAKNNKEEVNKQTALNLESFCQKDGVDYIIFKGENLVYKKSDENTKGTLLDFVNEALIKNLKTPPFSLFFDITPHEQEITKMLVDIFVEKYKEHGIFCFDYACSDPCFRDKTGKKTEISNFLEKILQRLGL